MQGIHTFFARNLSNNDTFQAYIEPIVQLIIPHFKWGEKPARFSHAHWHNNNTYTLNIIPPGQWKGFKAGQFIELSVKQAGAYVSRFFSISSSPEEYRKTGQISLTIRTQHSGRVTPWLIKSLRKGDRLYLSEAMGEFTINDSSKPRMLLAAGSGITPIMSMLRANRNRAWLSNTTLLFYVRNPEDVLFQDDIRAMIQQGLNARIFHTETMGRLRADHLSEFSLSDCEIYLCGPNGFMDAAHKLCLQRGAPAAQIYTEAFGPLKQTLPSDIQDRELDEVIVIDYQLSNKQSVIEPETGENGSTDTLLKMAEAAGLKPVSGCRMGICRQCVCKKKHGRVFNTKTQQMSDVGEEEIQLCLSVPLDHVALEL